MKKAIAILLTVCLLMGLNVSAYAADEPQVVVSNWDELQAAFAVAEDGDTIILAKSDIQIPNGTTVGSEDKRITLRLAEQYAADYEFGGSVLIFEAGENAAEIKNIVFDGNEVSICSAIHTWCDKLLIDNCSFVNCNSEFDSSLITTPLTGSSVTISNCSFENIHAVNTGIIYLGTNDQAKIENCSFNNIYGNLADIIQNEGTLVLNANYYKGNTSDGSGHDIRNTGTLTIDINMDNYSQYYGYNPNGWYVDSIFEGTDVVGLDPVEPYTQSYAETPCCLSFDSTNPNPQPDPEEPDDPQPPQPPYNPPDSGDDDDDDYTPPVIHKPTGGTTTPVTPTPAPAKPTLTCGGAVINMSRSVVLQGYEDGLLHEDDPLTRAQLAIIIYRLLDDESIARCSNGESNFVDVPPDAWFAPFVQTINCAGIVLGVSPEKYAPNEFVTWAQIITVLTRFVEPQNCELQNIQYNGWATQAVQTAVSLGWIDDSADFDPDVIISRGQLVQLVNHVLEQYR